MIKAKQLLSDFRIRTSADLIADPEISVIMPTYCRGDNGLLERAIRSVLQQSYKRFEFIIVDDGSVDSTERIVLHYMNSDNRIVYIRNKLNSGLPALRVNQGILHARGRYIAYQFDDDQWTNIALEALHSEILRHDGPCLVYGKGLFIHMKTGARFHIGGNTGYDDLVQFNRIINNSVMHPKSFCYDYGAYDCHLAMRRPSDWDLWMRWGEYVPFVFVDKLVSIAESYHAHSLGVDFIYDPQLFRICYSINRTEQLKLDRIGDYVVDDLSFLQDEKYKAHTYRTQIAPWLAVRQELDACRIERLGNPDVRVKSILAIGASYNAAYVIMIKNYVQALGGAYRIIFIPENTIKDDSLVEIDAVVFCGTVCDPSTAFLVRCLQEGIPTVYAIDDDLLQIHRMGGKFADMAPGMPKFNNLTYQLSNVNLVLSFSAPVSESVKFYNTNLIELTANIPGRYLTDKRTSGGGKFKIAFAGSDAARAELDGLWDDIVAISDKYGNAVEFHFWGYVPPQLASLRHSAVHTVPFTQSYEAYLRRLIGAGFDLLLCPLLDDDYRRGKSPIKFLEAAAGGAIGLYSDALPYAAVVDGVTGFKTDNGKGDWAGKIERIMAMKPAQRGRIRDNALAYVRRHYATEALAERFRQAIDSVLGSDKLAAPRPERLILSKPISRALTYRIVLEQTPKQAGRIAFRLRGGERASGRLAVTIAESGSVQPRTFELDLADLSGDNVCAFPIASAEAGAVRTFTVTFGFRYGRGTAPFAVYENPSVRGWRYKFARTVAQPNVLHAEFIE